MGSRLVSDHEVLSSLSEGLLRSACRVGRASHTLDIHHPFAPAFDPVLLHSRSEAFGVSLSLDRGREVLTGQRVQCDTASLPFQDGAFSLVVLHHVIQDGTEAELAEAVRVLGSNGSLVVLGLNRLGWRYHTQNRSRALPGMSPFRIKNALERLDMRMQGFAGAGFLGRSRPAFVSRGLSSALLPLTDVFLMLAGHVEGPGVTPLRFKKVNSGIVQSASLGGYR